MHNEPVLRRRVPDYGHVAGREQSWDFDADYPVCQTTEPEGDWAILPVEFPYGQRSGIQLALTLKGHSDAGAHLWGKRPTLNERSPITVSRFGCRGYGQPMQELLSNRGGLYIEDVDENVVATLQPFQTP